MTCVVLTCNPASGKVMALTRDEDGTGKETIADWPTVELAMTVAKEHGLIEAWGGWVVDLDNHTVELV